MTVRTIVASVFGVILSILIAFFGVFNVLFSDIFGIGQKAGAVVYIFVLYFISSLILDWRNQTGTFWRWMLLVPPVLCSAFIAVQDRTRYGYIFAVVAAVIFGTLLGRLVRKGIKKHQTTPEKLDS